MQPVQHDASYQCSPILVTQAPAARGLSCMLCVHYTQQHLPEQTVVVKQHWLTQLLVKLCTAHWLRVNAYLLNA